MYLKWGLPSVSVKAATLETFTASGLNDRQLVFRAGGDANIPPTARHKQICLETEVSTIPEVGTVQNDFAS
jgi:hypothetical protein